MADAPRVVRVLDPAERYFWLLGHATSVHPVVMAELDRRLDADELGAALRAVQRIHPFLRARIEIVDGEPSLVEAPGELPVTELPIPDDQPAPIEELTELTFDDAPAPLARFVYSPVDGSERSALSFVVHHAVVDASSAFSVLRQIMRWIERGDAALALEPTEVPPPLHERFPASLRSARGAVDVLAAIREERRQLGEPNVLAFHDPTVPTRRPRYDRFEVGPDAFARLRAEARAAGASTNSVVSASLLQATAALLGDEGGDGDGSDGAGRRVLFLATPTDLRPRVEPPLPAEDIMVAIGMLCSPYLVEDPGGDAPAALMPLARTIRTQMAREVERGESHLFYRFARPPTFVPDAAGRAALVDWVTSMPQNVTLSNLGDTDDPDDPDWVRRFTAIMPAGPNQVCFGSCSSYRGVLTLNLCSDMEKLSADTAGRLMAGVAERLGADHVWSATAPATTYLAPGSEGAADRGAGAGAADADASAADASAAGAVPASSAPAASGLGERSGG